MESVLENKRDSQSHAIFGDLSILYDDLLILDPRAFNILQCLTGALDSDAHRIVEPLGGR
jgi:hypothetical protein